MLKLATWNVNGIRARAAEVLDFLAREQPDLLCLQEIKASPQQIPEELLGLPGYHGYFHGNKGYSGVSLQLSRARASARPVFEHPAFDHETRIVTARFGDVLVASIYVPNGGKDFEAKLRFLEALQAFARAEVARGTRLLLCGDLNVALEERDVHPKLRKEGLIGTTPRERELLEGAAAGAGLVDLHRRFHPDDDRLFTWWAPWRNLRERNIGWRIDYVLASSPLAERALSCEVQRGFGTSDHGPLVATFDVELPAPAATAPEPAPTPAGQLPLL